MLNTDYLEFTERHLDRDVVNRSVVMAEYMRDNAYRYGLDGDVMYAVGLLHDIGFLYGVSGHEYTGSIILEKLGIKSEVINAIKCHGSNPSVLEKELVTPEYILLMEADISVNEKGVLVGLDARLEELRKRYNKKSKGYLEVEEIVKFIKEQQKIY